MPTSPMTAKEFSKDPTGDQGYVENSRNMLPLKLTWAWTIWKVQGQTIKGKMVINLCQQEKTHGLTYVAFSRATELQNIGLIGSSLGRDSVKKLLSIRPWI